MVRPTPESTPTFVLRWSLLLPSFYARVYGCYILRQSLPLPTPHIGVYGCPHSMSESTTTYVPHRSIQLPTFYVGVYRCLHPTLESTVTYVLSLRLPTIYKMASQVTCDTQSTPWCSHCSCSDKMESMPTYNDDVALLFDHLLGHVLGLSHDSPLLLLYARHVSRYSPTSSVSHMTSIRFVRNLPTKMFYHPEKLLPWSCTLPTLDYWLCSVPSSWQSYSLPMPWNTSVPMIS